MTDLRTRIAKVLFALNAGEDWNMEPLVWEEATESYRECWFRQADAVIRELEAARDELVSEAIRDLQERYILVPKSQTLADMAPPRLVINRDCTPLELPAEWKADNGR